MSFHKTQVVENLGTDPKLRHGSKPRATVSVAVNDRWTDVDSQLQQQTAWYRIVVSTHRFDKVVPSWKALSTP